MPSNVLLVRYFLFLIDNKQCIQNLVCVFACVTPSSPAPLNPFLPSGRFHPYQLDESIAKLLFRDVWCTFFIFVLFRIEIPVSK